MANPKSINQIIQFFESIVDSSPQIIKQFGYGNPSELDGIKNSNYPLLWVVPISSVVKELTVEHTFRFAVADLVHKDISNLNEVQSDCFQLLCDLVKIFRYENDDYLLTNEPVLEPFQERWGDDVSGYACDMVIEFSFNSSYCNLPFGDFGFEGPTFDGTTLTGRSGTSGFSGYSGYSGVDGVIGSNGASGYSGFSGISGYSGYSGISGTSGYSGLGLSGYSGISGYSGFSGYSGTSGVSGINGSTGLIENISFQDSSISIVDQTYVFELYAGYSYTINTLKIIADAGTASAAVKINGVDVTGISAVAVSSVIATGTASAANSVVVGDKITLVISSASTLDNLQASLKTTR